MTDCLNYGKKCNECSKGQQEYCKLKREKMENGTFSLASDYWDYINLVIGEDDDED